MDDLDVILHVMAKAMAQAMRESTWDGQTRVVSFVINNQGQVAPLVENLGFHPIFEGNFIGNAKIGKLYP